MAPRFHVAAILTLCLVGSAVAARDTLFTTADHSIVNPVEDTQVVPVARFNEELSKFEFFNETVDTPRRKGLSIGESIEVSATFYNSPGMDCTTGNGMCGYGDDVGGTAYGNGGPFVETSLAPYHCASGNFALLGGCGACGVLSYKGKARGFVVTDITDHKDDIGGDGQHIDLCLPSFQYFEPGTSGYSGGIFTGTWTRVDCSCMGAPNYPDHAIVVRTQAYNQWAKAVVVSRMGGFGEIASVNFRTRNGGFTSGARVNGWGAWWMPTGNIGGQGGVGLEITLKDGNQLTDWGYALPDADLWNTGNVYNVFSNVRSAC